LFTPGNSFYGTDRIDLYKTPATTKVWNVDKDGLPYPNNYFDEIKMEQILEHLRNVGFVVDEVHRVLKKGGKVILRTDHAGFIFYYLLKDFEHNRLLQRWYESNRFAHGQGEDRHYALFTPSHLRSLFNKFEKVKIEYFYMKPSKFKEAFLKILPFNLGASQIDLIAIK
jgi:ubiquinone/menaquinone biosynthesis C-methylase UbiE